MERLVRIPGTMKRWLLKDQKGGFISFELYIVMDGKANHKSIMDFSYFSDEDRYRSNKPNISNSKVNPEILRATWDSLISKGAVEVDNVDLKRIDRKVL